MKPMIFAFVALVALASCETVKGFGQDVSTAGDVISTEAQQAAQ